MTEKTNIDDIIGIVKTEEKTDSVELKKEYYKSRMTENKRFTIDIHRIFDNDEEIACADTMDDAEILVDLLNEQEEEIQELKQRNQRQYNRLKEITDLMFKRDWKTLEQIADDWEKADELLEQEWNNCEDL